MNANRLIAGAAAIDLTPSGSVFLFGYPNEPRWSTGVNDPLLATALYLSDGETEVIFIAIDLVFVSKAMVAAIRQRIADHTTVPEPNILVSATHTHSGPVTVDCISNAHDHVVPKADVSYYRLVCERAADAAVRASEAGVPAEIGLTLTDAVGVGTNRHDPAGPADPRVPVLLARRTDDHSYIGALVVFCMHPTVLHEDSKVISGDFPAFARQYLQSNVLGSDCPVLYHTGPAGNLSPRHVARANTIAEARRLGEILGAAVARAVPSVEFEDSVELACSRRLVELPVRDFGSVKNAERSVAEATGTLDALRTKHSARPKVRTAECNLFGARETLTLARAAAADPADQLERAVASCMPAEVQLVRVGRWRFVGWPGEMFVEFSLEVKRQCPDTYIIAYANGELQGYLVTRQAVEQGCYEASNALFRSPESGNLLVWATLDLMQTRAGPVRSCH